MTVAKYVKSALLKRIPVLVWAPKYNSEKLLSDVIAGITVGLTVMPQALAYATLAGLEPQYGLYSAFVGCFVYAIFGTCKDITIGPTALMALMTYQQVVNRNTDYAILLCFLSGLVQLIMAVLHLGVLIDFISIPVTVGFTSATSVIIMTSQLKSLLGLKLSSSGFVDTITKVARNIHETRMPDLIMGLICIVVLMVLRVEMSTPINEILQVCDELAKKKELRVNIRETVKYSGLGGLATGLGAAVGGLLGGPPGLVIGGAAAATLSGVTTAGKFKSVIDVIRDDMTEEQRKQLADACWALISKVIRPNIVVDAATLLALKLKDFKVTSKDNKPTKQQRTATRSLWLISTSRNALVVVICSTIAYLYETQGQGSPFRLTGTVRPGLPDFKPPPFETSLQNKTVTFGKMVADLGTSVILVPVIGVLGNVAISKAFASGQMIDATQELFTLSMCNVFGSFFSSMPITGSFSRSAVNHASGVQTPLGGVFTGVMVLLALAFLTPYFAFIPKASLAAVIISAVIFMIEYEVVKPMWRSSKKDLVATCATFVFCLLIGVEYGILVGVGINIMFLLYPSARPTVYVNKLKTSNEGIDYIMITPGNSLYFPAVDFIKTSVGKAGVSSKNLPVVIDCRYILGADFTAAKGISAMIDEFLIRKQPLYFLNTRDEVVSVFRGAVSTDFKYFGSQEEMEGILEENKKKENENEQSSLLNNGTICHNQWRNSIVELNDISYDDQNISYRKVNTESY